MSSSPRAVVVIVSLTIDCFGSSADKPAVLPPLKGTYRFRQLQQDDFFASPLGQEKGRADNFAVRMQGGHQAWGYVDEQDIIACYLWLTMAPTPTQTAYASFECGLNAEVPARAAYIWDCRSHPAQQGQGLYRHGLQSIKQIAAAHGAANVLIVSRRNNERSAASIRKVGFEHMATLHLHALFGLVVVHGSAGFKVLRAGSTYRLPEHN